MPAQEILAPFYVNVRYSTAASPTPHRFRLYFNAIPSFGVTSTVFPTYTDTAHPTGWTLAQIVDEVLTRFFSQTAFAAYTIVDVEMYTSNAGVNTFVGLDPDDYSGVTVGAGSGKAAAYCMYVFTANNKAQWRFTLFEAASGDVQRFAQPDPPVADDTTFSWFVIRSAVGFVTNDNLPLAHIKSTNIGFNRALARRYGRFVSP